MSVPPIPAKLHTDPIGGLSRSVAPSTTELQNVDPPTPLVPPPPIEVITQIKEALKKHKSYNISLAKLIVHVISGKPLSEIHENSPEYELAKKWVRNPSEKTYDDPFRAFRDLVENALDISGPEEEVRGFFGNGFLSSMIFVSKMSSGMSLISCTQNENFLINFTYKNEEIQLEFMLYQKSSEGTSIEIVTPSNCALYKLFNQCEASARFSPNNHCQVNYSRKTHSLGNPSLPATVFITLCPFHLDVTDRIGISLENAVTKLLIPGKSSHLQPTKLLHQKASCFVSSNRTYKTNKSFFILLRLNSVICEIPYKEPIDEIHSDFVVSLPHVDITTAKNEIIINKGSYEEKLFLDLINRTINDALNNPQALNNLYFGLQAWENQYGSDSIKGRFTSYLKSKFKKWLNDNHEVIPVNIKYESFFKSILPLDTKIVAVHPVLFDHNLGKLERTLIKRYSKSHSTTRAKCFDGTVIEGHHIIFVESKSFPKNANKSPIPSKFELLNVLFCPVEYLQQMNGYEDLANRVILIHPELRAHKSILSKDRFSTLATKSTIPQKVTPQETLSHHLNALERSLIIIPKNLKKDIQFICSIFNSLKYVGSDLMKSEGTNFFDTYLYILDYVLSFNISAETVSINHGSKIQLSEVRGTASDLATRTAFMNLTKHQPEFLYLLEKTIEFWITVSKMGSNKNSPRLRNNTLVVPGLNHTPLSHAMWLHKRKINNRVFELIQKKCRTASEFYLMLRLLISLFSIKTMLNEGLLKTSSEASFQNAITCLEAFIDLYLHEKITSGEIEEWYETEYDSINLKYSATFFEFMRESLNKLETHEASSFFNAEKHEKFFDNTIPVSLQKLTKAFFTYPELENLFKSRELSKALNIISRTPSDSFGRISHCVSKNSSRELVRAIITEWLQNSSDAYNSVKREYNRITIHLWTEKNSLCLSTRDLAGFRDPASVLEFFIVDHSKKETSQTESVGQNGNGIFKMYESAQRVFVTTQFLDRSDLIKISVSPDRDLATKQVVDLQMRMNFVEDETWISPFGSLIEVRMLPTDNQKLLADYLHARQMIIEILSSTGLDPKKFILEFEEGDGIPTRLNPDVPRQVLFQAKDANPITIFEQQKGKFTSYVTTQGIPLIPLEAFNEKLSLIPPNFMKDMLHGIIVDLPKGFYQPLQNRTEIIISEENILVLRNALLNAFYQHTLLSKTSDTFIFENDGGAIQNLKEFAIADYPNFEQDLDLVCLRKDSASKQCFMTYFKPVSLQPLPSNIPFSSFQKIVSEYMDILFQKYRDFKIVCEAELNQATAEIYRFNRILDDQSKRRILSEIIRLVHMWQYNGKLQQNVSSAAVVMKRKLTNPALTEFFDKYVFPWFEKKLCASGGTFPVHDEESIYYKFPMLRIAPVAQPNYSNAHLIKVDSIFVKQALHQGFEIAKDCLQAYCRLYLELLEIKTSITPTVTFFSKANDQPMGIYLIGTGCIKINLSYESACKGAFDALRCIALNKISEAVVLMNDFIVPNRTQAGTLNHELEHLIQDLKTKKNGMCEGGHGMVLNIDGETVPFEVSAIDSATKAAKKQLLAKWIAYCITRFKGYKSIKAANALEILAQAFTNPKMKEWVIETAEFNLKT